MLFKGVEDEMINHKYQPNNQTKENKTKQKT